MNFKWKCSVIFPDTFLSAVLMQKKPVISFWGMLKVWTKIELGNNSCANAMKVTKLNLQPEYSEFSRRLFLKILIFTGLQWKNVILVFS